VTGSEFNDILTGNGGNNTLDGRGGNDVLDGGGANDVLTGGAGADIFVYESGGGNDRITDFHRSEGDRIDLRLAGITGIGVGPGLATLTAGTFDPTTNTFTPGVPAGTGSDTRVTGFGAGNSIVLQGVAAASFVASDFIFASSAGASVAVTVQTPDGYDFSTLYDDMAASNPHQSANDATHIFAVSGSKTFELIGSFTYAGNDSLNGTATGIITEINVLDTADPTQTTQDHVLVNTNGWSIDAASFFTAVDAYAANNPALLNGIFNTATYSIVGSSGGGNSNGQPHTGADVFFGGDHADVFNGMPGPFGFGPSNPGNDTVDYSHAATGVTVNLLTGATGGAAAVGDIYISIENLRGTAFDDTLTGDGNNNVLEGGNGTNTLDGGGGFDTASYAHAAAGVTVSLALSGIAQPTGGAGIDTLTNIEGLRGSSHADTLTGNGGSVLEGGAGNDHLIGQYLIGQPGDTASYEHATAGVTVDLSNAAGQNTGGAGTDTLTNITNLTGSQFNDTLTGDSHDNTFFGNGGSDTFSFKVSGGTVGHDTIGDFVSGQDHIQLDYAAFNASDASNFSAWLGLHVTPVNGGDLLIDLNLNGQDTILLKNASAAGLHANDFILPPSL
jgi:Ca2+-binding RTX toxin-like protein